MSLSITVTSARPEELEAAFRLQFQRTPAEDRPRRIQAALEQVRTGQVAPAGVLLARHDGVPSAVMVTQTIPGASALVWPPQVMDCAERQAIEDQLVGHARVRLQSEGARLACALLSEADMEHAVPLLRNGFAHVTRLWYLRHRLVELPTLALRLAYEDMAACDRTLFQETLLQSYEGTLDCPEINNVRTVQEILESHRAQGRHDPRRWWLARDAGKPVGVLLLADVPELGGWDLSYLGVVPEARRRGVGRELTLKALWEARRAGAAQLSLAVDQRNQPAWGLYIALGFEVLECREVLLALFPSEEFAASG